MLDLRADPREKVVGLRQFLRFADAGEIAEAVVASDADDNIRAQVKEACLKNNIVMLDAQDMLTLGAVCGIKVGAAVVGIKHK